MEQPYHLPPFPVVGEVVEVCVKEQSSSAKIALKLFPIEIPLEILDDPHLGDHVVLEISLNLRNSGSLQSTGDIP